jgi:signal transduction histidine kinase
MITGSDILKARILIVDDLPANVSLLERMLTGAGYLSVSSTNNPFEVCELHRKNCYSLILLDLQMPGMDGFQVMQALKEIKINCHLPILVITAHQEQKLRALKAGAADFVSEPIDLAEVVMRVHNLVEIRLLHEAAEQRLEQAEGRFIESQKVDSIGQLAGGVAHDFNNILAIIMGYTELIQMKLGSDHPINGNLEMIRNAAERGAGLTRQLLIYSRKQTIQLVVLDLNEIIEDLGKMLQRLMHENIEMTIIPGKQTGRVKADSGYIGQLLINLVVNARDAMPNGGKVTIETSNILLDESYVLAHPGSALGSHVMLSVRDTGSGMTDAVKAHIFEALFTTKPKGEGTGLGLATCQTIVQQCGGHIDVDSQPGQGTTFKIYFPQVEQGLKMATAFIQAGPVPRGNEILLIVEDDPSVRDLARDGLRSLGYEVLTAINGQDAMQVVDSHRGPPIRLIVTDVIMPVMGGKDMADWLRITNADLKFLFTSGYTDGAIAHHGVLEMGVEFLPKPYTPATLGRKVRAMLDAGASN